MGASQAGVIRCKPGGGYVTLGDLVENDKFMEYCRECEVSSLGAK